MKLKISLVVLAGAIAGVFNACSAPLATDFSSQQATTTNGTAALGKLTFKIMNAAGSPVYSDDIPNSLLQLKAGDQYQASLDVANAVPGATFKLLLSRVDILNGPSLAPITIVPGQPVALQLPLNGQGEYALKLVASVPGSADVQKLYTADVQCAQPTFTAASLNAGGLTASSAGPYNLFSFSGAGVVSNANGMGPYLCAFDPTGTQTQDTAFLPCAQAQTAYVNYIGQRNIGVLVKDACFTVQSVTAPLNLQPPATPMVGGDDPFISGQISNAMGTVATDARVNGVKYLATNSSTAQTKSGNVVQPTYNNGSFNILSVYNYQMPSSMNLGVQIQLSGLTDNLNLPALTGTISAANARIQKVVYTTDQRGDQSSQIQLSSMNCTLSQQNATVEMVQGPPCEAGKTGDNNSMTIKVYGHYSCPQMKNADGSAQAALEGDFNGLYSKADSCVGGGGNNGGGIVPINF